MPDFLQAPFSGSPVIQPLEILTRLIIAMAFGGLVALVYRRTRPADDAVAFIDWQMTMQAPIAVELGWFLVSNSASLPVAPDEVVRRYRDHLDHDERRIREGASAGPPVVGDWDLQRDLTWIVGLLLRGWRKGLDAAAGVTLPSGISAADDLAWWCDRATEAAARRL